MNDLAKSMMLWLPSYLVEDESAVNNVTRANGLIFDFCNREISLEQVLDEFSSMDVSADEFRETLLFNLEQRGA